MLKIFEDRKHFLTIFIASIFIYSTVAYVSTTPRPKEQFFQFYVLGGKYGYYPSDNPNISLNMPIHWHLGVSNSMGSAQYVLVKAKLGNVTLQPPNETNVTPANLPTLIEFNRILLDNEVWETSFTWEITNIHVEDEMAFLTLSINNKTITIQNVGAKNGENFRFIFELWTLDKENGNHIFGWKTQGQHRTAWLQVWFNAPIAP